MSMPKAFQQNKPTPIQLPNGILFTAYIFFLTGMGIYIADEAWVLKHNSVCF